MTRVDGDVRKEILKAWLVDTEGLDPEEISTADFEDIDRDETQFSTEYGDYYVLQDKEADELAFDMAKNLVDEMGIDGFSEPFKEWILDNAVDTEWFDDAMRESYRSYVDDIENERASRSSSDFENRLVEELYENGIIDDSNFDEDEEGNKTPNWSDGDFENFKDQYVESLCDQYGSGAEWYRTEFGEKDFFEAVQKYSGVDEDKIAQEVVDQDGRGTLIAGYDSEENEFKSEGNWFYIYRTN